MDNRRTFSEIVGTALEVYGQGFGTLFTIAAAGQLLSALGWAYLGEVPLDAPLSGNLGLVAAGGAALLLGLIPHAMMVPALLSAADDASKGDPISVGSAFDRASARVTWEAAWANLVSGWLILGGLVAGIAPGIVFGIWFCLTDVAVVLEGRRDLGAIKRSQGLVRGHAWKAAGLLLVGVLASALPGAFVREAVRGIAGGFLAGLMGIFATPFQYAVQVLLYYDLKARKEGETAPESPVRAGQPNVQGVGR